MGSRRVSRLLWARNTVPQHNFKIFTSIFYLTCCHQLLSPQNCARQLLLAATHDYDHQCVLLSSLLSPPSSLSVCWNKTIITLREAHHQWHESSYPSPCTTVAHTAHPTNKEEGSIGARASVHPADKPLHDPCMTDYHKYRATSIIH